MVCELYTNIAIFMGNLENFENLFLKLKEGGERRGRRRKTQWGWEDLEEMLLTQ